MKKYSILFLLFLVIGCSRPHTITKGVNPENVIHYSQISNLKNFSELRNRVVYLEKGDQFPMYLSMDTNLFAIPDKMVEVEAKQKLFFMLTLPEDISDEEIDRLINKNGKEINDIAESDVMEIFEKFTIYISRDATEWAQIDDFDALKKVFDSKGGSISLGVGVDKKSGLSSYVEIKEEL
jgi:hypothetical protein